MAGQKRLHGRQEPSSGARQYAGRPGTTEGDQQRQRESQYDVPDQDSGEGAPSRVVLVRDRIQESVSADTDE